MSVAVDLTALQAQILQFGPSALLVTTSTDAAPHVASVLVTFDGDTLAMRVGRQTRANAAAYPMVALVWPAGSEGDYCLIVDATARDVAGETLLAQPTAAVLHRVAHAPTEGPRCVPVDEPTTSQASSGSGRAVVSPGLNQYSSLFPSLGGLVTTFRDH